jgi:hypothetical protein
LILPIDFTQNGLDFYWQGAIKNLNAEADALELAFIQQEGFQMPGMLNASSIASSSLGYLTGTGIPAVFPKRVPRVRVR